MNIRNKIATVVIAVVAGSTVASVVAPTEAEAATNRVCHNGSILNPPVRVSEKDGSNYLVYGGQCTPGDVPILGWMPTAGTSCVWKWYGGTYKRSWYNGHWITNLGRSVSIASCRYEFDD